MPYVYKTLKFSVYN